MVYPGLSLPAKTNQFKLSEWGLDGGSYLEAQNPDEMAAIRWLQKATFGNIAEAVSPTGGSYTGYARAATLSGLPGVLGWVGHESQWRGGGNAMGNRQADLARLFCSRDPEEILAIIHQYQISYIFLGDLERSTYKLGTDYCPTGLNELILNQIFGFNLSSWRRYHLYYTWAVTRMNSQRRLSLEQSLYIVALLNWGFPQVL